MYKFIILGLFVVTSFAFSNNLEFQEETKSNQEVFKTFFDALVSANDDDFIVIVKNNGLSDTYKKGDFKDIEYLPSREEIETINIWFDAINGISYNIDEIYTVRVNKVSKRIIDGKTVISDQDGNFVVNKRKEKYSELGFHLGTPGGLNAHFSTWNKSFGFRASLGVFGLELNPMINLWDDGKNRHSLGFGLNAARFYDEYLFFFSPNYSLYAFGFHLSLGPAFGWADDRTTFGLTLQLGYAIRL